MQLSNVPAVQVPNTPAAVKQSAAPFAGLPVPSTVIVPLDRWSFVAGEVVPMPTSPPAVTLLEVVTAYEPKFAVPVESFTVLAPMAILSFAFAFAYEPSAVEDEAAYEYAPSAEP